MRRALAWLTLTAILTVKYTVIIVVGTVTIVGGYLTWALWCAEEWARDEFRPYSD